MATEVTSTDIATAALGPAEIEGDQGRVKQRSVQELMEAANYAAARTAANANRVGFGLRVQRIKPGDCG